MDLDQRVTPARGDLAAKGWEDRVAADRFVAPRPAQVVAPVLDLRLKPENAGLATQLIFGEGFEVLDLAGGLAWGQSVTDGYVGYVAEEGLAFDAPKGTAVVSALSAHVYPEPNIKSVPLVCLPWQARVAAVRDGAFWKTPHGYLCDQHLGGGTTDWVASAGRLLGVPYLWGGRSSFGLDCSGLVQLALASAEIAAPRDSDMQRRVLGHELAEADALRRGDLIFWDGHVGIMEDEDVLLHATAHQMAVVREALATVVARIEDAGLGPIRARKRLDL